MPQSRTEPFVLHGYGDATTRGSATVISFHRGERFGRAGKGLALAWAAALASVFIPVAHVVLVPGFALAGVLLFVRRSRSGEATESVHGTCPDCGREQEFDFAGRWHPPTHLTCVNCGRLLTARPVSDSR